MTATEVRAFNTADWAMDQSFLMQLQQPGEAYTATVPFYLVEHPAATVLVDTGVSHDLLADPAEYGKFGAPFMEDFLPFIEWDESMHPRSHLEDAGVAPAEVDYVVMTHLHSDHAGNVDLFPDAEFVVHRDELRYAWWPDTVQRTFYLEGDFAPLRSSGFDVTVVEGRYDVLGDGSVVTVPTPGHTPGHQSVMVELDDETLVLGGDVAHRRPGYDREIMAAFNWSLDESLSSVRRVKALARAEDATVRLVHDREDFDALAG